MKLFRTNKNHSKIYSPSGKFAERAKNVGPIRHCEPPHAACFTLPFTKCRYCSTQPAHRCPQQHRQRVTEGTAMAPWNGPNNIDVVKCCQHYLHARTIIDDDGSCKNRSCGVDIACRLDYCNSLLLIIIIIIIFV